ncbi:DUF998 domain-containing protein [Actinomadura graeca]|uniref:DUF998 domain-containing protein n=1 Tax=Actinomadura graeca TaxID=2750812 RepID=A0ABX8R4S2_9ACTN|nr:DUF998 domain-containing protein [Actinomadura graeca]QXJ26071.1 DUF998 domain-containing protein [Actinomadura graeca]
MATGTLTDSGSATRGRPLDPRTRAALACGVAAGPLFVLLIAGQYASRAGFDPARHPLSMLSLGEQGWLQTANFLVSGMLVLASAAGLKGVLDRRSPGGTWGPRLVAVYGAGLVWAGLFRTDPAEGYPAGAPDGAAQVSWHGALHNLAPVGIGLALSAACLVFARRFARQGRTAWTAASVAAPSFYFLVGFSAFPAEDFRLLFIGGAAVWLWASALSLKLLTDPSARG